MTAPTAPNAETVQATIFGVDPWGANQAAAIIAIGWRPNTGRGLAVTLNPTSRFRGNAVVPVQRFLGQGQLEAALGANAANNNPTNTFHASSSGAINDPVMAILADQLSRGA